MDDRSVTVRAFRAGDEIGVRALLQAHMQSDETWPPPYARASGDLDQWLAGRSRLGRWVALEGDVIVGHVGVDGVEPGAKADRWQTELACPRERLAEIGRLVVHPAKRRTRVSERLTRRCVRDTVTRGFVPVASALGSATASQAMMTSLGWRIIGEVVGARSGSRIVLLVAPQRLIDAALGAPRP